VLNWLSTMPWRRRGEWRYSSYVLDLGNRWTWVVSFTPLPIYPRGMGTRYPLDRRLGWYQYRSGKSCNARNRNQIVQPVVCRNTDRAIPTSHSIKYHFLNISSLFPSSSYRGFKPHDRSLREELRIVLSWGSRIMWEPLLEVNALILTLWFMYLE
jgi:hypothetical protein